MQEDRLKRSQPILQSWVRKLGNQLFPRPPGVSPVRDPTDGDEIPRERRRLSRNGCEQFAADSGGIDSPERRAERAGAIPRPASLIKEVL